MPIRSIIPASLFHACAIPSRATAQRAEREIATEWGIADR